jgi:hypothetical protein
MNFTDDLLALLLSMRLLSEDSSSDGCFVITSQWLQNRLDTHDECPKQMSPLPSRAIAWQIMREIHFSTLVKASVALG